MSWREMTEAERERAYSPSSCLADGDYRPFVEQYRRSSDAARARLEAAGVTTSVISYGIADSQTIDVAVPLASDTDGPVPVLVFFHGGYWQELSKFDSFFAAWDCVNQGFAYAAVDYTLAPVATVDEIVDECRQAVAALHRQADSLGIDRSGIHLSGSSAGAHLAAMATIGHLTDQTSNQGVSIAGVVLVSGIFELEALLGTSINQALGLDVAGANRNSPLLLELDGFPPTVLAYGENETAEFKAQSEAMATRLIDAGAPATVMEIAGRNHFDVILALAEPGTDLGTAVSAMINAEGGAHAEL